MKPIRIATRASALALAQANWVADRLTQFHPGLSVTMIEVTTTGDADRVSPVTTLTEVGAFVRAVQLAVLDGSADVAVHSCKDLPVAGPHGLTAFYPERESPSDVLCGCRLDELDGRSRVGTGSPRRREQLRLLAPDAHIAEVRGNVDTRLDKVASGELDAVVLAEAGLNRIGRPDAISHRFTVDEMVTAPAQGALALETLAGSEQAEIVGSIDDIDTRRAVEAERGILARTGAGCRAALGAIGMIDAGDVVLTGFVADAHGSRRAEVRHSDASEAARLLQEGLSL